jgi:hypothetical protein
MDSALGARTSMKENFLSNERSKALAFAGYIGKDLSRPLTTHQQH